MPKKKDAATQPAKDDVTYVGIPSIGCTSSKQNNWWRSHNNTLQQVASYTNYASPFRQKYCAITWTIKENNYV